MLSVILLVKIVSMLPLISGDVPNIIDLSVIDYSVSIAFDDYKISIKSHPNVKNIEVKHCESCQKMSKFDYKCSRDELLEMEIELMSDKYSLRVPFNASCLTSSEHKTNKVRDLKISPGVNNISLSWNMEFVEDIDHYLIYCMDSIHHVFHAVSPLASQYSFINLQEKSWYRTCIAVVDKQWRTSGFLCNLTLTDFSITGPVMNITSESKSDRIKLSWNKPLYLYDDPNGYIINVTGPSNMCRSYIIEMTGSVSTADNLCQDHRRINWDSLQNLKINNLSPFSNYQVEIFPINGNRSYKKEVLSIKTKEGESEAVENLVAKITSEDWLFVIFNKPSHPNGIIIKYLVEIIQTQINICSQINKTIHQTYFNQEQGHISTDKFSKCGSYVVQVTPINGWDQNGGKGKPASTTLAYNIKPSSTASLDVSFVSSNSMRIRLFNIRSNENCEILAFAVMTKSTSDSSNCMASIVLNDDCQELRKEVSDKSRCSNIELKKLNKSSSSVDVVIVGIFKAGDNYETTAWTVDNKIWELESLSSLRNTITDCFTDCHSTQRLYSGIRSAADDGNKCEEWRKSPSYSGYKDARSNICTSARADKPWCPIGTSYKYCDVPKCSAINYYTGCVQIDDNSPTSDSLFIKWSPSNTITIIGYITLLHNTDHLCEQYHLQICDQCKYGISDLQIQVKNFYLSCQTGRSDQMINKETRFNGLHQNKQYFIYIIPIIDQSNVGEVKNISVTTLLSKPITPQNVAVKSRSLHQIDLSWDKQSDFTRHGEPEDYTILVNDYSSEARWVTSSIESIQIDNLKFCTRYCFKVGGRNKAGSSDLTEEICSSTLAPKPDKIEMETPVNGYSKNRVIKWRERIRNNCERIYRIEYSVKHVEGTLSRWMNETSIELGDLRTNVFYKVRVRMENQMETINDEKIGEYSDYKEFYTGHMNFNLSFYGEKVDATNKVVNVSWEINEDVQGSLIEFIILLRNSSNICTRSVNMTCKDCDDPWKSINLDENVTSEIKELLNCTESGLTEFGKDKISFCHVFHSENILTNFSIEIYGVNLVGIHVLHKNSTQLKLYSSNVGIILLIFAVIIFLLFGFIALFLYRKRNSSVILTLKNPLPRKTETKQNRNISSQGVNGIPPQIKPNRKNPVTADFQPMVKAKKTNTAIALSSFASYYERVRKNQNFEIIKEYKKLTAAAKSLEDSFGLTVEIGKDSENSKKNRFVNILPFDQNRVKLETKKSDNNYINASFIPFISDETRAEYIAAQGPIDGSLADFWQMIWEQKINCIIMLTQTMEDDKFKCLQYWPDPEEITNYGHNNEYRVQLIEESENECYFERELIVENEETNEKRNIIQLHMHTWMDHAAPNMNFFDKLLFRFQEIISCSATHPFLIHCSAGVGRTGTLICLDRIVKDLVNGCQEINIYETVLKLRHYRNFMVQRQAQYIFIHDYLNHFLQKYMKMEGEEILYFNEDHDHDERV